MNKIRILMLLHRNLETALHDHRVLKEIHALADSGYEVELLLFGSEDQTLDYLESARFVQLAVSHAAGLKGRLERARLTRRQVQERHFDIVHCHDFSMLENAFWAGISRKHQVVYDSHEYFAGSTTLTGRKSWQKSILIWLERIYIRKADLVITVGEMIARRMERELKIPRVEVVRNTSEWELSFVEGKYSLPSADGDDPVRLVSQGVLSEQRGTSILVEIMRILPDRYKLSLLGTAHPEIQSLFSEFGDRVIFKGQLSLEEMQIELRQSHIGVYPIQDVCLSYRYCLPNKLFEAISCRLPIVFSDLPEIRSIIDGYKIGAVAEADKSEVFAEKIIEIVEQGKLAQFKDNFQEAYRDNNWLVDRGRLVNIYNNISGD